MATGKHIHRAVQVQTVCFSGPVVPARRECPEAHGGVTEIRTCRCGATRRVNINGRWVEEGFWALEEE